MSAILSLRDVWIEYGDKVVLERVSIDIEHGSFVSIIGPSGAGKSSLLRLVLGQEAATRGSILLDGTPLTPECGPDRGVVFQRYSVYPHLSVRATPCSGWNANKRLSWRACSARRVAGRRRRRRRC